MKAIISITPITINGSDIQAVKVRFTTNQGTHGGTFYAAGRSTIQRLVESTTDNLVAQGCTTVDVIDHRSK